MKSIFIDGLLKQDIDSSAVQVAMWENMTIWKVAYEKLTSYYSKQDEISQMIEQERMELIREQKSRPTALEARVLMLLCDHLSININEVNSVGDIDDIGLEIERKTIELEKRITKNEFKGNSINELIKFNLKKMFDDLSENFEGKSLEEQNKIVEDVMNVIDDMPDEQKEIIRKELNVDDLSQTAVYNAIKTGTMGIAFATLIEVAGFSAYMFATEALAAIVGIAGLTLPFAAYTTLTSFMAALANPLLIVPGTLGLGYYLTRRGNKKIRDNLLPTLVTQTSVLTTTPGDIHKRSRQLLRRVRKLTRLREDTSLYNRSRKWVRSIDLRKNK